MTMMIHLTQNSNARKSYHLYYLHVLLMELFLVTDPPLILIELLNFYGILSEGFLISVLGQGGSCKKKNKPMQLPFLHTKFVVFLQHRCSIPTPPPVLGQKRLQRRTKQVFLAAILVGYTNISTLLIIH